MLITGGSRGIVGPLRRLEDFTVDRIERVLAVNLTGALLCARAVVVTGG